MFGSDICTCRPYLIYGIEEAVKEAQKGGSGGKYTRFHFTTLIFNSVCIFRFMFNRHMGNNWDSQIRSLFMQFWFLAFFQGLQTITDSRVSSR